MRSDGFHPLILKVCACTGFAFAFLWPFAATVVSGFQYILPPSAADPAPKVVAEYLANTTGIRIATVIFIFSSILYTTWSMSIIQLVRRRERQWPILFNIMVVAVACEVVVVMFIGFFFGAASWRPGETSPEVTQALNDLGWLGVLFTGAPFALFQICLAVTTLLDKSVQPAFPRWSAYYNLFASFFMCEASLLLFFKTGPFSQDGVLVFYVPMIVFFVWIVMFSVLTLRAINAEAQRPVSDPPLMDRLRTPAAAAS
ncbi:MULTISPECIES: hypothetical protein [Mycobacterium]|uniref:DUF4386 domain-containing protein n=1 Tax=Mycobacterium kiyosense TaxID=2871094 RepID=A0A9P3Q5E9_9MYCO|nr:MULTISPECIES: hypothetical protein [Mycobacterium]BDB43985.1 hypothetical protein IWGMT90018_44310 [Mycobacterium kiyosense]BDE15531.1 hypothetical protein MKCMC460_43910 [Mycobacterium sp. 20KCMC460]GLB81045.1 hypothetical protein SRL2020028_03010 [Mycobacterium kiyosense]GLB87194.1 hypothetical protein SRL2020130_00110 [Mycobacterium kiyosense]GLB93526.1 hypothetical protein SRL2020226_03020 [Mycobacterium kiyosense]